MSGRGVRLGSGLHVKDSVAEAVRANGSTQSINDLARQVVKWKSAA